MLIAAGVVSAGFATYPFALIASIGTYPLVASIALASGRDRRRRRDNGTRPQIRVAPQRGASLIASTPALATVHPSALVMLAALTVPIAVVFAVDLATAPSRSAPSDRARGSSLTQLWVVALMLLLRTEIAQTDSLRSSVAQALGEVVLGAFGGTQIALVSAGLTLIGIVVAARRRRATDWIAIGLWATMAAIYVGTAGGDEFARLVIGGPWYSDASRIAAFTPVVVAPLAAAGAARMLDWLHGVGAAPRRRPACSASRRDCGSARRIRGRGVCSPVRFERSMAFCARCSLQRTMPSPASSASGPTSANSSKYIARHVPADDVIANNPADASGFIYPLTGRHLLVPYMLSTLDDDRTVFYAGSPMPSPPIRPVSLPADSASAGWSSSIRTRSSRGTTALRDQEHRGITECRTRAPGWRFVALPDHWVRIRCRLVLRSHPATVRVHLPPKKPDIEPTPRTFRSQGSRRYDSSQPISRRRWSFSARSTCLVSKEGFPVQRVRRHRPDAVTGVFILCAGHSAPTPSYAATR